MQILFHITKKKRKNVWCTPFLKLKSFITSKSLVKQVVF